MVGEQRRLGEQRRADQPGRRQQEARHAREPDQRPARAAAGRAAPAAGAGCSSGGFLRIGEARRAARPGGPAAPGRAGRAAARPAGQIGGSMRAGWPAMTWIRWPSRSASSGSWVTSSTVRPASSCAASAWRRARVIASSAENGSSISTTGRSSISVRASAARWRWPPESVAGSWSRWRARPTRASSASAARGPARSPRSRAPSVTLPRDRRARAAGRPAGPSRRAARRAAARRCTRPRPRPAAPGRRSGAAGCSCRPRSGRAGRCTGRRAA